MKICYEKVITDALPISSAVICDGGSGWHHVHPEFELSLVEAGRGIRCVGSNIGNYRPHDLTMIAGMLPHSYAATDSGGGEELRIRNIKFMEDFAGQDFFRRSIFSGIRRLFEDAAAGLVFPLETGAAAAPLFQRFFEADPVGKMLRLLDILDLLSRSPREALSPSAKTVPFRTDERLSRILQHIHTHIDQPEELRLERIARVACLSPGAFSWYFHQQFNRRYLDYVNELRISVACSRLSDSLLPITRIAYEVGFGNLSNFNRTFLRYKGCSPSEYRQRLMSSVAAE